MTSMATDLEASLATLAGLPGWITRWQCVEPRDQGLLYARHGDPLIPLGWPEQTGVQATLRSTETQEVVIRVNALRGWSVTLNGLRLPCEALSHASSSDTEQPATIGGAHRGRLQAGLNRLEIAIPAHPGQRLLGAQLSSTSGSAPGGVTQLWAPSGHALKHQLREGLSTLWAFNQLNSAPMGLSFEPGTDWATWREALSLKLAELLAAPAPGRVESELIRTWNEEGYRRERHFLTVESAEGTPGPTRIPVWILVPEHPNGATLLCIHGHGYSYGETLGLPGRPPAAQRELIRELNYDYARQAARRGYFVIAPGLRGFGLRSDHESGGRDPCDANYMRLGLYGTNLVALQLHDLQATLRYLETRREANIERLGSLGLSYGGRMTMYLAATDPRIRAAVVSGSLNTFKERFLRNQSCGAQIAPGLLRWADVPEILGLIAPRPLFLELGSCDPCCPELFAAEAFGRVLGIYEAAGAADELALEHFDWGHRFNGVGCWEWLQRHLVNGP